jgi:hypothetical protein
MPVNKPKSNIIGCIASIIFALLSLAMGWHTGLQVNRMETAGIQAEAVVTAVHTGARNSKTAVVAFRTGRDEEIVTECLSPMLLVRNNVGDRVTVLYEPDEPTKAMIDNGAWNWGQPVIGVAGFVVLAGIAVLMLKK